MSVLPFSEVACLFKGIHESGVWEDMRPIIDRFIEADDDIGAAWATWVYRTRRWPEILTISNGKPCRWDWFVEGSYFLKPTAKCIVPRCIYSAFIASEWTENQYRHGSSSFEESYAVLLVVWRMLTSDGMQKAIEWGNTLEVSA